MLSFDIIIIMLICLMAINALMGRLLVNPIFADHKASQDWATEI